MKKIISLIMCVILIVSTPLLTFASEEEYYLADAVFSDNVGVVEHLQIMKKDGDIYANAEELGKRLGYKVKDTNGKCVSIYNKEDNSLPYGVTQFFYNETRVRHTLFTRTLEYEAPFTSVKNENGIWVPLKYFLVILNSGILIQDDKLMINMPEKKIVDLYTDILRKNNEYSFEWTKDIGYSGVAWQTIGVSSHFTNLFNGMLDSNDYLESWSSLFKEYIFEDFSNTDKKYGEDLAMLICTQSNNEIEAQADRIGKYDTFLDSIIGNMVKLENKILDNELGEAMAECDELLEVVKKTNSKSSVRAYNVAYQKLEKTFDRQTWFSDASNTLLNGQLDLINFASNCISVNGYLEEFNNQDEFSVQSLDYFLENSTPQNITSKYTRESMKEYSNQLKSNVMEYSIKRWHDENKVGFITGELELNKALPKDAQGVLIAWDLASTFIPYISNGLEAADKFELALYSLIFQTDALVNYQNYRNQIFENTDSITPENLYKVSQYGYIYLKSCFVAREAALGSLKNKSQSTKNQIQGLIDYQNGVNKEIAEILVALKNAQKNNKENIYGLLPADNGELLASYDDSDLYDLLKSMSTVGGKVVDEDGNSIVGAKLVFKNSNENVALSTNNDGSFSKKIAYGTYTLIISKDGYETKQINIEVNDSQKDLGQITLEKEELASIDNNYLGQWSYEDSGKYVDLQIDSLDKNNISFSISSVRKFNLTIAESMEDTLNATLDGNKINFTCKDGWDNSIKGTIEFKGENVYLQCDVLEYGSTARWSIGTDKIKMEK